jgi:hypothetical protein
MARLTYKTMASTEIKAVPTSPPPIPYAPANGAQLSIVHAERAMNVYPITEPEVMSIGLFNTLSAAGFAIGGTFLGFAASIWISATFSPLFQPAAVLMVHIIAPASLTLAVVSFALAGLSVYFRGSTWRTIKNASIIKPKT